MNKEELKQNVKTFDTPVKKDWDNLIDYVDEKTSETGNFLPLTEFVEPDSTFVGIGVNSDGFLAKALVVENEEPFTLPYKSYVAKISQSGTSNPTVVILENNLGFNIEWSRSDVGIYVASVPISTLIPNKTTITALNTSSKPAAVCLFTDIGQSEENYVFTITTYGSYSSAFISQGDSDTILDNTVVEIRIYD